MRSLFSQSFRSIVPGAWRSGRSVAAIRHRGAIGLQLMLAMSFAGTPFALVALAHGQALPVLLAILVLAAGVTGLACERHGNAAGAGAAQTLALMLAGLVLTVADPAILDFGLALALMGPVGAAVWGGSIGVRAAWVVFAVVAGLDLIAAPVVVTAIPQTGLAGALALFAGAAIVAISAGRSRAGAEADDSAGEEEAFRHIVENVRDAVLRFDVDGRLAFASRSSEKLFGCPRYALGQDGLVQRIHVLDRPNFLTALSAATRHGRAATLEIRLRQDDPVAGPVPRFAWMEVALSPIAGAASAGHEVVALVTDITERRDRQRQVEDARQAAEDASRAKSRFLATIGHELRTPLNAIVGFSEMMAADIGGELSTTHREYAQLIGKSGRHLIEVISMLLDMSRLDAGKFELQTGSLAPAELIAPCLKMIEPLAAERGVTVGTVLADDLPEIVADERACRQILINLLSNAVKFSHAGGRVTVTLRRRGQNLAVAVADRGIGMDAVALTHLGEAFFQAQDGLDRRYEGTGLGLSIVRGLVELHGGSLNAISEPGQGTTMTVLLPVNGPATKPRENAVVRPLHAEPAPQPATPWPDARRNAL